MSSFKLLIPKVDETFRSGSSADLSALPSVPDVLAGSAAERQLQLAADTSPPPHPPPDSLLDELLTRSAAFPTAFPVDSVRCSRLLHKPDIDKETLLSNADSAYPVVHEKAFYLLVSFLEHKRQWGTAPERALYADMSVLDLVDRLLLKRAVCFVGPKDRYLLQDGTEGSGGWELVGSDDERPPLQLRTCLSYDEMKLSALLSVSSHSVFINDGRRNNCGVETDEIDGFQRHGIIVGIIGTRFQRAGFMEYQEVIVSKSQNVEENGYGHDTSTDKPVCKWRQMWAAFYGVQPNFPLYEEAQEMHQKDVKQSGVVRGSGGIDRYTEFPLKDKVAVLFDNMLYQRRMSVTFETLLLEAAFRAEAAGSTALLHVVGAGLGVWRISKDQERHFLDAFGSCIQRLLPSLSHVSEVRFAWFSESATLRGIGDGGRVGHIRIRFSQDAPQSRLGCPGQLLVVSFAWDSNSLSGNEFWWGGLSSSGDPAAACSSQIAELHTASINSDRVCSKNLHIASPVWGVLHVSEYARRMLKATTSGGGQPPDSD